MEIHLQISTDFLDIHPQISKIFRWRHWLHRWPILQSSNHWQLCFPRGVLTNSFSYSDGIDLAWLTHTYLIISILEGKAKAWFYFVISPAVAASLLPSAPAIIYLPPTHPQVTLLGVPISTFPNVFYNYVRFEEEKWGFKHSKNIRYKDGSLDRTCSTSDGCQCRHRC